MIGGDCQPVVKLGPGPPESCFYILEQAGQPIGMGGVRRVRDGVCEMKRVYIRDAAKGQGLGRLLAEVADLVVAGERDVDEAVGGVGGRLDIDDTNLAA